MYPRVDLSQLEQFAKTMQKVNIKRILMAGMESALIIAHERIVDTFLSAPGRLPTPNPYKFRLRRDSGTLANTLRWKARPPRSGKITGLIVSDQRYMAIHEFGGIVPERRPKNAKALKIPLPGGGYIFRKSAKAFTMPERKPIRSGLMAARPKMVRTMEHVIVNELVKVDGMVKG